MCGGTLVKKTKQNGRLKSKMVDETVCVCVCVCDYV